MNIKNANWNFLVFLVEVDFPEHRVLAVFRKLVIKEFEGEIRIPDFLLIIANVSTKIDKSEITFAE